MDIYQRFEKLIGRHFEFRGCQWELIEIMPENDSLVLRRLDAHQHIQQNQFGAPIRFAQQTETFKISSSQNQDEYSEDLSDILTGLVKSG